MVKYFFHMIFMIWKVTEESPMVIDLLIKQEGAFSLNVVNLCNLYGKV